MRLLLVVLLLALLPLHLSWAAVAPYCSHELATQSQQHGGHHDHSATADPAPADADADADPMQPECGQCHNHCTGIVLAPVSLPSAAAVERFVSAAHLSAADQAPSRPERPQWARLA
jgi:hypothetical protein